MTDLRALADQVLAAVRDGGRIPYPERGINRLLVDDMFGGTPGWEALKADLDTARQESQQ